MKTRYAAAFAAAAFGLGAVAVQGLHAQVMPKAYAVAEFDVVDAATFKEFAEGNTKGVTAAGGRFLVRPGRVVSIAGDTPKKFALVEWPSFDQAHAYYTSDTWKKLEPLYSKGAKFRAVLIEGLPPQ
jgi:uncharacterized protein (DUF1330 family)